VLPLPDAERRRLGQHEASADHLRPRPRQPAALLQVRQGGPTAAGGPATTSLAAAPPSNRTLNDVQPHSITTNQAAAISALFRVVNRYVGNLAPMPGVFPDYKAPIVRAGADGRELATARWGMPSSQHALMEATKKRAAKLEAKGAAVDFGQLLRMEPDGGTTNIRNVTSKHWTRWLGVENRCVVPFNSFSEFNKKEGGDIWFALDDSRPLASFAASGRTGRASGRSKKARRPTTSTHSSRRSRTSRSVPSTRKRCP
jgi:putative SOS response-associated peptidase YedK